MFSALREVFRGDRELSYLWGVALVAGAGTLFSFTAVLFRGVEAATDWQFLIYRGGGTGLAMAFLVFARRNSRPVPRAAINKQSVVAGFAMGAMSILYILALARTTAATVTFLVAAGPFFGAFFGWIVLRERVERRTWGALAIALVGISIMVGAGLDGGSTSGVVLAAAIPVILGFYNVLIRSAPVSDPLVPIVIASAVIVVTASVMAGMDAGLTVSLRDMALGLVSGGVLLGLGLPMFNLGHLAVPTAQVSLLLMTEIVLTPVWVWIWPGETPAAATLVGGAIVIAAVAMLALTSDEGKRWISPR